MFHVIDSGAATRQAPDVARQAPGIVRPPAPTPAKAEPVATRARPCGTTHCIVTMSGVMNIQITSLYLRNGDAADAYFEE
jgi:hypothetical protein